MKRISLSTLLSLLLQFSLSGQIIISQYYEGASNDKYLEITNLGATPYDLAAEGIRAYLFANERADDPANNKASIGQALHGTILPLESLVFCNGLAVQPGYTVGVAIGVNFCGFNGDDLLVLSTATDGLSVTGSAWANRLDVVGSGSDWGTDIAYVRKNTILSPNTDFTLAEWTVVSLSVVNTAGPEESNYLGTHYTVLPIKLADFKAEALSEYVLLFFTTLREQNNAHFLIQRSTDEGKTFETIGQLAGQGDSNEAVNYEFVDTKPAVGMNYYRLQQFDFDGTNEFFGPVAVRFRNEAADAPVIWPVPARDRLQIELPASDREWRLEVFDLNGRRLLQQTTEEKGLDIYFDLNTLPAGSYFLRWSHGNQNGQERFLKL